MATKVSLPPLAPIVCSDLPVTGPSPHANVQHFRLRLQAMQHYVNCCAVEFASFNNINPVQLFVNVPQDDHGYGSFIVVHLDRDGCVYSMEYVSCTVSEGLRSLVLTPIRPRTPMSREWAEIAARYEDIRQLQRWAYAISDLNIVRDYSDTVLSDLLTLLARVPQH